MVDLVVVPWEGRKLVASWFFGKGPPPGGFFSLHLFKEVELPFDATLRRASFTESDFGGYAPVQRPYSSNAASEKRGDTAAGFVLGSETLGINHTFGEQTVKGFWVQDNFMGKVLVACLYAEPVLSKGQTTHTIALGINVCQCADG